MKRIFMMMLCSASLSCHAELSQLEDMDQYSISNSRGLVANDDSLLAADKIEVRAISTLGGEVVISETATFLPSHSDISVRDTGHTMTLRPILIQVGNADF